MNVLIIPQRSGDGADGSIMIFKDTELTYPANAKLDGIIGALENILSEYSYNYPGVDVSAGDMCVLVHSQACSSDSSLLAGSNLLLPLGSAIVPVLPSYHFSSVVATQQWLLQRAHFVAELTRPTRS